MTGMCKIKYFPHNKNTGSKFSLASLPTVAGYLGPIIIPPLHILIAYYCWHSYNRVIDKNLCSCSCWDSIFKGPYESGVATYKHIYFNSTANSFKIWTLTVICILLLYEALRWTVFLALHKRIRFSMAVLFFSAMFSHYYSWWMFFNYWNDDYYTQWYHQLFFSLTELLSTILVLQLSDKHVKMTASKTLPVVAIALVHIFVSCWDQFIMNVLQGEGYSYQVVRDIGFMVPDVLHVAIPILELNRKPQHEKCVEQRDYIAFGLIVVGGLLVTSIL